MFRMATLENPSELYRMYGGIIADEMGLGKTITMLSLLLVNRGKEGEVIEKKSEVIEKKGEVIEKKSEEEKSEMEKNGELNQTTSTNDTAKASREKNSKPQKRRNKPWEKEESTELATIAFSSQTLHGRHSHHLPTLSSLHGSLSCNPHL